MAEREGGNADQHVRLGTIADRLDAAMMAKRIRPSELARRVGVSRQCMSQYRSGRSVPRIETIRRICMELDIDVDWFLGTKQIMKELDQIRKENDGIS